MNTRNLTNAIRKPLSRLSRCLEVCSLLGFASLANAQTLVSGNISGTWSPSGNPYVVTDNATVPSGQTLTIQPGTIVWIGSGLSITANGTIQAVGTASQRITFQAPIASQFFNAISVNGTVGTNKFKYCDFQNATNALIFPNNSINEVLYCSFVNVLCAIWMPVDGPDSDWTQTTKIMNCTFTNVSPYSSIAGEAVGHGGWYVTEHSTLNANIRNCTFENVYGGCYFYIAGTTYGSWSGIGYCNLQMMNNVFCSATNGAVWLTVDNNAGNSPAILNNNTVLNAGNGVMAQDPWDAKIQSCIFEGCSNAVTVSGALSRTVGFNDFYNNATDFTGYPSVYGLPIIANRNGTSCDLLYNIFQDPKFVSATDFHLQTNSLCIDAGTPDWNYSDMCFFNGISQGCSYPDQGAYGGPDAVNWLDVAPKLPVIAFMSQSNQTVTLNWGALPRSSYQVQCSTNLASTNWVNFPNGSILAADKPVSLDVTPNASQDKMFFRVQSLGRTPGN